MKDLLAAVIGLAADGAKMKNFLLIIFSVVTGVAGQLALKHGVSAVAERSSSRILQSLDRHSVLTFLAGAAADKFVLLGFALYLVSAMSWLIILSRVDLSFAYPLISIGYILIMVLSKFIFNEQLTSFRVAGTLMVCAGVFVISLAEVMKH